MKKETTAELRVLVDKLVKERDQLVADNTALHKQLRDREVQNVEELLYLRAELGKAQSRVEELEHLNDKMVNDAAVLAFDHKMRDARHVPEIEKS